jgi:hypothetical protein
MAFRVTHPNEMNFSRLKWATTSKQIHNLQIKSEYEQRDWRFATRKVKQNLIPRSDRISRHIYKSPIPLTLGPPTPLLPSPSTLSLPLLLNPPLPLPYPPYLTLPYPPTVTSHSPFALPPPFLALNSTFAIPLYPPPPS